MGADGPPRRAVPTVAFSIVIREEGPERLADPCAAKRRHYKELEGEEFAEDVVDGLRIGLAAGGLHDLADEEFEDAFVARFKFGYVVRIFRDDFAGGLLNGGVADLGAEAFGGDDFGGGAAGIEHGGENSFGDSGGNFAGFDELQQFGERGRR